MSAASVYRGEYSSTKRYYGNSFRVDIVKYNSAYYISRVDAPNGSGGFTGVVPTNTNYWNAYGASFESVATSLLLAELANIAGFIFRNNRLESQTLADGSTTDGATSKTPMVFLNGLTGQVSFAGGKVVFNADGTVNIGNGKFTVDKNGNTTMNNVTMNNITANSGTFMGDLYANKGVRINVKTFALSDESLSQNRVLSYLANSDSVNIVKYSHNKSFINTDIVLRFILLENPQIGQRFTFINNSQSWMYTWDEFEQTQQVEHFYVIEVLNQKLNRVAYFNNGKSGEMIFDGTRWHTYTFN